MTGPFKLNMKEATRLTRLGKLDEAVGIIMAGLKPKTAQPTDASTADEQTLRLGHAVRPETNSKREGAKPIFTASHFKDFSEHFPGMRPRPNDAASKGQFTEHLFSNAAGSRQYKLYVPDIRPKGALPLVVMLHGCTQSPDDFAAGTRMNELADEFGFLVVYPAQPQTANASKCWNWFNVTDQKRGKGEPSLIAGITRNVMRDYDIDKGKVFIAGLSAGGAAAAIMAETYPDLYCAVGVHSGLACGAAKDMVSAFAAMKQGPAVTPSRSSSSNRIPVIVFHGDGDNTVHPTNAEWIINAGRMRSKHSETTGQTKAGVHYTRAIYLDDNGKPTVENWSVHGGGHAWFGGSSAGSYTDPAGPDASREMVRFFLEQARE